MKNFQLPAVNRVSITEAFKSIRREFLEATILYTLLTTIRQPLEEMGRQAGERPLTRIRKPNVIHPAEVGFHLSRWCVSQLDPFSDCPLAAVLPSSSSVVAKVLADLWFSRPSSLSVADLWLEWRCKPHEGPLIHVSRYF